MMSSDNPVLGEAVSTQLFRAIVALASHLRTRMDQRLASIDLTTQQAAVLTVVDSVEVPPTLGQVARMLGSSHQNVRQIVAALERKGLLEVTVDPGDRRVRRLSTTPAVGDLFADRDLSDHQAVDEWLAALSADEQALAAGLLRRVLADLTMR